MEKVDLLFELRRKGLGQWFPKGSHLAP